MLLSFTIYICIPGHVRSVAGGYSLKAPYLLEYGFRILQHYWTMDLGVILPLTKQRFPVS